MFFPIISAICILAVNNYGLKEEGKAQIVFPRKNSFVVCARIIAAPSDLTSDIISIRSSVQF